MPWPRLVASSLRSDLLIRFRCHPMECRTPIWQWDQERKSHVRAQHLRPKTLSSRTRPSPLFHSAIHVVHFGATKSPTLLSSQARLFVPMIDHIFGRPSPSWKRTQVGVQPDHRNSALQRILTKLSGILRLDLLDMETCIWPRDTAQVVVAEEDEQGTWFAGGVLTPELRMADLSHAARFSPWQIIVGSLTTMYASRNLDKLLGLGGTHIFCLYLNLTHALPHLFPVAVRRTSPGTPC